MYTVYLNLSKLVKISEYDMTKLAKFTGLN